jgi:hypothetical protein
MPSSLMPVDWSCLRKGINCGALAVTMLRHCTNWEAMVTDQVSDVASDELMLQCMKYTWATNAPGTLGHQFGTLLVRTRSTYITRNKKTAMILAFLFQVVWTMAIT